MSVELNTNVKEFIPGMIRHMCETCRDHDERIEESKNPNLDLSAVKNLLGKGIWYPIDYCRGLEKFGQKTRFEWMIRTGATFHGMMPATFASVEDSFLPTKKKLYDFRITKEATPSAALEAIKNSPCILGCGEVRDLAVYQSLKDLLREQKFDLLFASNSATPLQIGGGNENPFRRLFKRVEVRSAASLEPGDFCHFSNIQQYIAKHPFGHARGYNVMYKEATQEGPKFLALGLKAEGCLAADVEKALLDGFNQPQESERFFNPSILSHVYGKTLLQNEEKSKAFVASFSDLTLTQEEFDELPNRLAHGGGRAERRLLLSVERPDLDKIERLSNASLSDIRKVFDRF